MSGWSPAWTKKNIIKGTSKHFREMSDLVFADGATSRFDIRDDLPGHVGAVDLHLSRQLFLGQASKSAKSGNILADVIGLGLHLSRPFPSVKVGLK